MPLEHFATHIANITQKRIFCINSPHLAKETYTAIISFGYFWQNETFLTSFAKETDIMVLHPLICPIKKTTLRYEIATEFGVAWLLAHFLLDSNAKKNHCFKNIDVGYLSSESNLSEELLETHINSLNTLHILFVLGEEIALHDKSQEIAHLIGFIAKYLNASICIQKLDKDITPQTKCEANLVACDELPESNGFFIYALLSKNDMLLQAPALFAPQIQNDKNTLRLNLFNRHNVEISIDAPFKRDNTLKGTIALLHLPHSIYETLGYPYKQIQIKLT